MARALATQGTTDSRYLEDRHDIVRALKVLRDQRADITVAFDGKPERFQVRVLDVIDGELLLEDIRPRSGHALLSAGEEFTATCRVQGLYTYFAGNRVVTADAERGVPYYRLPLPTRMLYQQRRKAARFRIPLKVAGNGSLIELQRDAGEALTGEIIDISAGGCRAAFSAEALGSITVDQVRENCYIQVPKLLELEAIGIARHAHLDAGRQQTVCGIELVDMSVTDRRRLERFIQTISRSNAAQRA